MIFSELYSAYYNAVADILTKLTEGVTNEKELSKAVLQKAFGESLFTVLPSLKSGKWKLMHPDFTTPIKHRPTMPLTDIQKRWLKSVSLDPRIKLFGIDFSFLDGVEPLFTEDDYRIYDKYSDGDDFCNADYIERFRIILDAIRKRSPIRIEMVSRKGQLIILNVILCGLEYSEKDDKFRVITIGCRDGGTVNLGRILACKPLGKGKHIEVTSRPSVMRTLVLTVTDERNALERVMMHFAHFEKQVERIDELRYRLTLKYDRDDETELVIRVLSFGPFVKAEAPESFVELIKDRLRRQKSCRI